MYIRNKFTGWEKCAVSLKAFFIFCLALVPNFLFGQCEVHIVEGTSIVFDHNPGISFGFEIQNDSDVPYMGGTLGLNWALSGNPDGPVWEFELNGSGMILPGESRYIGTPVFDIPLPENVPGNWYSYGGWTGNTYFPPGWALFLDSEPTYDFNGDGTITGDEYCWDYVTDPTQPNGYFADPLSEGCYNPDLNIFCDDACEIQVIDFNLETTELTIIPTSTYCPNINSPIWENQYPFNNPYVFAFSLNFNAPGVNSSVQLNQAAIGGPIYASDEPIIIDLSNILDINPTYQNILNAIENTEYCDITITLFNINNIGEPVWEANESQILQLGDLCVVDPINLEISSETIWTPQGSCTNPYYNQSFIINNIDLGVVDNFSLEILVETWQGDLVYNGIQDYEVTINPGESYTIIDFPDIFTGDLNHVTAILSWINENDEIETYTQTFNILLWCWGCTDPEANNYINSPYVFDAIPDHWLDDFPNITPPTPDQIECTYNIYGCTDAEANNYNPLANVDDGSCTYDILGCTDPSANNFNPSANIDDGSCTYDVFGCTDSTALNYNPFANIDDGSCEYAVYGCTDPFATNYNPLATVDDGSCVLILAGCTDPLAINYNPDASEDDGSCVYNTCGEIFAPNTFTPNNDGVNDGWAIVTDSECWLNWSVKIYNRWGSLVWESNIPGEVWVGSNHNGSYYVADGVYVYSVKGVGYNPANTFQKSGTITIFR
jgi:gliding motility-associated-like protein